MYNCGPTVYSYAHIGNFRAYVFADVLRRTLEWKGYQVKQIMNITDVGHLTVDDQADAAGEDKVEKEARRKGQTPQEIAEFYTMAFFEDVTKLNLRKAWFYPRATDHIAEMQDLITLLLQKGAAYRRPGGVYFSVDAFKPYGRLSGNTLKKLQAGKRVEVVSEKKNPLDFALWIINPKHVMQWPSPWGRGYPGWHIECSAMSLAYLGEEIDIHTGGEDNIFPHHECEIAQAEAAGKKFVRFWLHTRHLFVNGQKMSKSLGNFYTLRDLLQKGFSPREVRFLLLSANYRTRLNFTEAGLANARTTLASLDDLVAKLQHARPGKATPAIGAAVAKARKEFEAALDDDLNLPEALAAVFGLVRVANRQIDRGISTSDADLVRSLLLDLDAVLGLDLGQAASPIAADAEIHALVEQRERFRREKKWQEADRVRHQLAERGYVIEDTSAGPRLKKAASA